MKGDQPIPAEHQVLFIRYGPDSMEFLTLTLRSSLIRYDTFHYGNWGLRVAFWVAALHGPLVFLGLILTPIQLVSCPESYPGT